MTEPEILPSIVEESPQMIESAGLEQNGSASKERMILEELIDDLEDKAKVMLKYQAVIEITQASDTLKKEKIRLWADRLEVHERTVTRLLERVEKEGVAALARLTRADAGSIKGSRQWKGKTVEEWIEFIKNTYRQGNTAGRVMNRNQAFGQVKGHAELELGLKEGEYPGRGFVYTVLESPHDKKKKRNPGMGPRIVVKVTDSNKNVEEIVVERSNQVWQIDNTLLDNLLVDANGEVVSTVWVTAVIDTYSSCVMGYYLGFVNPGSHEIALALRHAILQKQQYGPEYGLKDAKWETHGLPEYIVTDRAKEFKSGHLRRVAMELGIKMRLRLYTEQGGVVERLFLGIKNEFSSMLPGYKGGSLKERPAHPEKHACICYEEYDRHLVRHIVAHRNTHLYPRVKEQTCQQRWSAGLIGEKPRMPSSERDLDVCLMKETERTIQKYGCIEFQCLIYGAGWKKDDQGLWRYDENTDFLEGYEGKVTLRYNPSNIVYILVYTKEQIGQPSRYLGTIRIKHSEERDLYRDEERLSLKEWEDRKKRRREKSKLVDQSSVLAEQRALFHDSNEAVAAHRKRKRAKERKKDEHHRIIRNSDQSNVVELPVQNSSYRKDKSETITDGASASNSNAVESTYEQTEIQIKPALYVVSEWNEFVEDGW